MAESLPEKNVDNNLSSNTVNDGAANVECAVCLQTCVHPAELPCGHVFCYLCIKGIVNQGRRCAMCRQDIPIDFLDRPRLLKPVDAEAESQGFEDGHLWFYEGHNGWWQYDERTSVELETAYQNGDRCCELLIAGFLYLADFDSMLQYRRNDPSRRRRIKRDLATTSKKGVAGLKLSKDQDTTSMSNSTLVSNILVPGMQNLHISSRLTSGLMNQQRNHNFSNLPRLANRPRLAVHSSLESNLEVQGPEPPRRSETRRRRNSYSSGRTDFELSTQRAEALHSENEENLYSGNSELDSVIHDTLDWTIQQIESLQLELTNDYENLSEDVNHYERLQNVLDYRSDNESSGYLSRPRATIARLNRSLENELDLADRVSSGSRLNRSAENVYTSEETRVPTYENDNFLDNIRGRLLMRSRSSTGFTTNSRANEPTVDESIPRLRGLPRARIPRAVPRRVSSLRSKDTTVRNSNANQ